MKYIALILCFCHYICSGQPLKLLIPIEGRVNQDFYILNYVDHDSSPDIRDVFCGERTYNGHTGTDFCIRGFSSMDSGVNVLAAADGRVIAVVDGKYDRSKHKKKGGFGNYIAIIHQDSLITYYCHLKKNSIRCVIGDNVITGQKIAQVGSSGYSSGPHLHFEIRNERNTVIINPFMGNCSDRETSYWISQPRLDTDVHILESGFNPYIPLADSLQEGYKVTDTFYLKRDSTICFWAHVSGLKNGR